MNVVSHRTDGMIGVRDQDLAPTGECPFRQEHDNCRSAFTPIGLIGISYHTATLQIRSKVGVVATRMNHILRRFDRTGFEECVVLSTCNRTEVYFVGGSHAEAEAILADEAGISFDDLEPHIYAKSGANAAHHLFGVASGLDSAVLGETEILAQIKGAVATSRTEGMVGRHLDFLIRCSQAASRRVRTETELCRNVTSVGSLAVRDADKSIGGLAGKVVVVLGAGKIAERVAKDLVSAQTMSIIFVNRTLANAESLALKYGGEARPMGDLESSLREADVVFTAASCEDPIIDSALVERVSGTRASRPLTLVDLGVPRNTHASASEIPNWEVLDMDAIMGHCGENSAKRAASIPRALEIMGEELDEYLTECSRRAASPTIEALVKYGNHVKEENLTWAHSKLSHLSEKDLKVVSDLATRMVKGFLQSPIKELKEEVTTDHCREAILKLFHIEAGGN